MEIEAKFNVPNRAVFDRLAELNELAGYQLESAGVKQIQDRYLDTDDRAILRAGYACRVRRRETGLVATLKGLGGADAESGVHRRAEYEAAVEDDDPETWPEGPARDLVLLLSYGRPLVDLFSLRQKRHIRLFCRGESADARRVAEMSLDVVTPNVASASPYFEVEIELLEQGHESDLRVIAGELRSRWELEPEPRSKFQRGLALIDKTTHNEKGEREMKEPLSGDERAALNVWREIGNQPEQRRARIILMLDEGYGTDEIAQAVGLSTRQVRRWIARFRQRRMEIFPALAQRGPIDEAPKAVTPVLDTVEVKADEAPPSVKIESLLPREEEEMARAEFVRDLALELFNLTTDVHRLAPGRRDLLSTAALLHNLGAPVDPARRHLAGRDLILAQPIVGLGQIEQDMLASLVAFHRKKVRRQREEVFMRLSDDLQRETLVLAALLRIALALDRSKTQSATIEQVEMQQTRIVVTVGGAAAEQGAAAAERRSKLWNRMFDVDLRFLTERQRVQVPFTPGVGTEPVTVPELDSPGLSSGDPMSEAGRKTLWFHFLRMLKHEPGTRAGEDIEELHDMRVATRRMRAAVRVFGDFFEPKVIKKYNKGIKRVTQALGPVRDLDVFEEKAGHYLKQLPPEGQHGLDPLIESWDAERESAREKMLAFLDSDVYRAFKRDFARFLQTEGAGARSFRRDRPAPYLVRHVAPRLIYTRYETVRAYETVLDDARVETLHALRIDCKYLRYTLEFLREVLGPEGEDVIKEVKAMQDHLGDLNDAEVAIGILSDFLATWDAAQTDVPLSQRRSAEGIVTYLASRHAEKHRLMTTFPEAWARLNREEVRRWLALAIAVL